MVLLGPPAWGETPLCGLPLAPVTHSVGALRIPDSVPFIEWSRLTEVKAHVPPLFDGFNSTSFTAKLGHEVVHVKVIDKKMLKELISNEIHFYHEFSRRQLAPSLIGITKFDGKHAIISEFVEPAVTLKTGMWELIEVRSEFKSAAAACRPCQAQWAERLEFIAQFLEQNRVQNSDLQFMLMKDGTVLLYDFTFYQVIPAGQPYSRGTVGPIIDLAKRLRTGL
jgi:hypothetical protein